jgi:medium-chain acyl-[acyl-carrier-protein] hydrolase
LFCFAHAGSGASFCRTWGDALPLAIDVHGVQLPGHENRLDEPLFTRLEPLVESLQDALAPYLVPPFAFFGHSMGALIAFELTRALQKRGGPAPAMLAVSGRCAPQLGPAAILPRHDASRAELLATLAHLSDDRMECAQHPELLDPWEPVVRADLELCETYEWKPGATLICPIAAFGGRADPHVTWEGLDAWHVHSTSWFSLDLFAGDHFFFHADRGGFLRQIVTRLHDALAQEHGLSSNGLVPVQVSGGRRHGV